MLELLRVFFPTPSGLFKKPHDLLVEKLLLRHQLQVALRPRPRTRLKTRDRLLWLAAGSSTRPGGAILVWSNQKPSSAAPPKVAALLALALGAARTGRD